MRVMGRSAAECLVLPSKLTGIMAAGRPVVATVRDGLDVAALIGDGGMVTPPGDGAAFARAIESLARDAARREAMGRAARAIAEREFDKEVILGWFVRELEALVAAKVPHSVTL